MFLVPVAWAELISQLVSQEAYLYIKTKKCVNLERGNYYIIFLVYEGTVHMV